MSAGHRQDMAADANPLERAVKLSCRNVWKLFGDAEPGTEADLSDPSPRNLDRMRRDGIIPAVVDASFDVHVGEIFVIMGLSGSGKSTLIRCLSKLVEPSAGHIMLDGKDLLAASRSELVELRRRTMGMVFQGFSLLPHLTVLENVGFPLKMQGRSRAECEGRAREMVVQVGLGGREQAYPRQLSGGQQQRVGIARSLAADPELWFLDEPFSALDPLIRRQMQDEFLRLQRKLQKTIVFITHDVIEAFRLADRVAIMRGGRIVQIGRPSDILLRPADDYVERFIEDTPLLRVIRAGDLAEAADGPLPEREVDHDLPLIQVLPKMIERKGELKIAGESRVLKPQKVLEIIERAPIETDPDGGEAS